MVTIVRPLETAARQLGIRLDVVDVRRADQFESAFEHMTRRGAEALVVLSDPMFTSHSRQIVTLAMRYRLPSAYELRDFAVAGGLLSYGPTTGERWEQVAHQVDRILRGTKAGDLPIQQPTKLPLVINLKTAKRSTLRSPTPCYSGQMKLSSRHSSMARSLRTSNFAVERTAGTHSLAAAAHRGVRVRMAARTARDNRHPPAAGAGGCHVLDPP